MTKNKPAKARKVPFATVIDFTKTAINNAIELVHEHDLPQVQFCSRTDRGFHLMVYRSGEATFYATYSIPKRLGVVAVRKSRIPVGEFGLHTVAQARAAYQEVRRKAYAGIDPKVVQGHELTYRVFHIDHYRVQCVSSQKKTLKTDIQRYDTWIAPDFAHLPLSQINVTHVNKLVIKMQQTGRSAATIRNVVGQLSSSLNLAVDLGYLEKNSIKSVKLPKVNNQISNTLSRAEMKAFMLAATKRTEMVASRLLMLLAHTGARLGEATNAKWVDIDFEGGIWRLPTQKSGKPGVIHLSEAARAVLREVQPFRKNDYVFPGEKTNALLSRPIRLFKRILKDAEITGYYRIHDLRHAWCSNLIEAGIPIEVVSQGARHSSPVITRRYIHPHASVLVAANECMAQLLAS